MRLLTTSSAFFFPLACFAQSHSWEAGPGQRWILWAALAAWLLGGVVVGLALRRKARRRDCPHTFLLPGEEELVLSAIRKFERRTSGEIHVHLSSSDGDIAREAQKEFDGLGLANTRERNGVLFFVAVPQRRFAVLGDVGIHQKVPPDFWQSVVSHVEKALAEGHRGEALATGIEMAGHALVEHFPARAEDVNELPDAISRK
jgi:uncharacterized membrane protein